MSGAIVIAVLGAESTGKSTLAVALAQHIAAQTGLAAKHVDEHLRSWCEREGRTPRADEQRAIAQMQQERIAAAAATHDVVVADTTALMIAVYSDQVFGDTSLYADAEAAQARCAATLLTALDLPWQSDGHQRDGPHVRDPVDAKVRAALERAGTGYAVVSGVGPRRLAAALAAVRRALSAPAPPGAAPRWQWHCERCGDPACERHLLPHPPAR